MNAMRHTTASDATEIPVQYRVIHGYRRAFRMLGEGPPLLLIHGIGDSSATWLEIMPALAERYTVIAPDLLGHGASDRPRADYGVGAYACGMRDLLAVLGIDQVSVVGHSLGGGVAMQFAYQFPTRVQRIVLVAAGGVGRGVHPVLRMAAAPGSELVMKLATLGPTRAISKPVVRALQGIGALDFEDDLDYLLDCYDELGDPAARRAFLRTLRAVVDFRGQVVTMLDRAYLQAGIPTMLVWGDQDRIVPWKHAPRAAAALAEARLEVFEGTGHFPHHSDPQRFVDVVLDHLDNTEPANLTLDHFAARLRTGPARITAAPVKTVPVASPAPTSPAKLRVL